MYNVFEVTDWGLTVGNKNIAPGSKLLFKGVPPVAWKSVGHSVGNAQETAENVFGQSAISAKMKDALSARDAARLECQALKAYIKEMREYYESKTEQTFEVATPADDEDGELEALRAQYEEVLGKKPHHMMKAETLKQKIEEAE